MARLIAVLGPLFPDCEVVAGATRRLRRKSDAQNGLICRYLAWFCTLNEAICMHGSQGMAGGASRVELGVLALRAGPRQKRILGLLAMAPTNALMS